MKLREPHKIYGVLMVEFTVPSLKKNKKKQKKTRRRCDVIFYICPGGRGKQQQ